MEQNIQHTKVTTKVFNFKIQHTDVSSTFTLLDRWWWIDECRRCQVRWQEKEEDRVWGSTTVSPPCVWCPWQPSHVFTEYFILLKTIWKWITFGEILTVEDHFGNVSVLFYSSNKKLDDYLISKRKSRHWELISGKETQFPGCATWQILALSLEKAAMWTAPLYLMK